MMPQLDNERLSPSGQDAAGTADAGQRRARVLTEDDAIEIWLARWLKTPRKVIVSRYACDARRIYEVWEGRRYPLSRAKALERLRALHPSLPAQTDVSRHRRIPRGQHPSQLSLFEKNTR